MEIKRTVLKYLDRFSTESYVKIDHSSGYPTAATALQAHDFRTVQDAKNYADKFPNTFKVIELYLHVSERDVQ